MDNIIFKTKQLIDVFENSELIKNLDNNKKLIVNNNELLDLINKYKDVKGDYERMALKKEIFSYPEYEDFMKYYNELFIYILKINKKFKEYTDMRGCKL